jgi:alkylation response protein AidB-like acyl-CoA dehydrogenase
VQLKGVEVTNEQVLAGPVEEVMAGRGGGATGGLQTSTLAIGAAKGSIDFLRDEAEKRQDLLEPWENLCKEHAALEADLLALAGGEPVCSNEALRQRSNSLVLRASQAALAAAKGSGYVVGHPAGRWCREALFFLVWSCPQSVMQAHLCELAGIAD